MKTLSERLRGPIKHPQQLTSQRIEAADSIDELVAALEDYKHDILAGINTISIRRLSSNETGYAATMELKVHDEMLRSKLRQLDFLIAKHKGGTDK